MIVTAIFGGLGNQMFQYAAGKAMAMRNYSHFEVDRRFLDPQYQLSVGGTVRNYELDVFRLNAIPAMQHTLELMTPFLSVKKKWAFDVNIQFNPFFILENRQFAFQYLPFKRYAYIYGYWQSWRYFEGFEKEIRNDFTFRNEPEGKNLEILKKIEDTLSVSVHIRLGDYGPSDVLSVSYYTQAIESMKQQFPEATFFVFSDNPEKAKTYFEGLPFEVVTGNSGAKSYVDMLLMSRCKHHIIANSSFSWWGAWLNPNPDKVVIAPKVWYRNANTDELIPKNWIKIG
jgi:hypothetical protein